MRPRLSAYSCGAARYRRPLRLGHPTTRDLGVTHRRRQRLLDPGAQHRLGHDAGVDALQPVVEPAGHLLQEADGGLGRPRLRPGVRPRADQALAGAGQAFQQSRDRVGVAVGPAADRVHRGLDVGVVLAHRALLPVGVAALMAQPVVDERRRFAHPLEPHLAPAVTDDLGIGRPGVPREHRRRPLQHVRADAAAVVVDVVGVAVVGRAQGHDGLQRRRSMRRPPAVR